MNDRYDQQGLFGSLHAAGVRYVVVGGWAARLPQGCATLVSDGVAPLHTLSPLTV